MSPDGTFPPTFDISPSYISSVDAEFSRVYEEYTRRVTLVQQLSQEIITFWAELGTPQAQTETSIVEHWQDSPEQIGLHQDDVNRLKSKRDRLAEEKRARERKLKDLRASVESLWNRLQVDDADRKAFQSRNRGCGLRAINDLEDELSRLNELKRQNLHLFVEDARTRLQQLWDELYFSEEEAVEFTPMFCDVYSDALLSAHEAEITKLEAIKEQRAPMLSLVEKHRSILKDKEELATASQDASRLIAKKGERRDPTRLLREEKMRKRIARELPKVEKDLAKELEAWEDEYGRPFLVFGDRYLDVISSSCSSSAASKPAPSRAKTPVASVAAPRPTSSRTAPQAARSTAGSSYDTSTLRSRPVEKPATATRSAAPSRAAGPVPANKSPSRIPARAPLGTMTSGSNSPERKQQGQPQSTRDKENTIRGKAPPMMAPPPKMRDLVPAPQAHATPTSHHVNDDVFQSGSTVRAREPEDPYKQHPGPMAPPPRPNPARGNPAPYYPSHAYSETSERSTALTGSTAGGSRQTSNTSYTSRGTANASSENWESYASSEDGSANGTGTGFEDAAGYSHQQAGAKRAYEQYGAYATAIKKMRPGAGMPGRVGNGAVQTIAEDAEYRPHTRGVVDGSDAGWTDEDAF